MSNHHFPLTQLQQLADTSFDNILKRAGEHTMQAALVTKASQSSKFSWSEISETGEIVVMLREGGNVPLILVHGTSVTIVAFDPLQGYFTTHSLGDPAHP